MIFAFLDLDKFAKVVDLANILNLVIFVFLDLSKIGFELLPTNFLILALINIEIDRLVGLIVLNIEISDIIILLKR